MKNLKVNILVLLLFSVFACDTQQVSEDELPIETRSSFGTNPKAPTNPAQKTTLTMIITVQYPDHHDRDALRALVGPILGLSSWSSCFSRNDVENWVVNLMTESDFRQILDSYELTYAIPIDPTSAGSAGATDPYALAESVQKPLFYYAEICE